MPMQAWFPEAKLGIFVHWGIYAVDGVAESWSLYQGTVSPEQYYAQLDRFTAKRYDPEVWAALFAGAGARYAVLTARHHDGVSLWPSAAGRSVGRDLIGPYASALRDRGLRVGLYYSHSDWSHPDYPSVRSRGADAWVNDSALVAPPADRPEDPEAWQRYLAYRDGQVNELVTRYRPDLLWFDGEWERAEDQWGLDRLATQILASSPSVVLNGRMLSHGDYATPEQGVPVEAPNGPWELCLTINDSWGFQHHDRHYKSADQLIQYFTETIAMGGNLLLDVGPEEDGTIPPAQVQRLHALGGWIGRHADAIYPTVAGLPHGHYNGPTTLATDRRTLFLFVSGVRPESVAIRGLRSRVCRATVLSTGTELPTDVTGGLGETPGVTWVTAPTGADVDPHMTVIAVELDGELDLYRGTGRR
jgi:alpha-L-fucosidase